VRGGGGILLVTEKAISVQWRALPKQLNSCQPAIKGKRKRAVPAFTKSLHGLLGRRKRSTTKWKVFSQSPSRGQEEKKKRESLPYPMKKEMPIPTTKGGGPSEKHREGTSEPTESLVFPGKVNPIRGPGSSTSKREGKRPGKTLL